jgi:parallel beta-helix repeat protein
MKFLAMITMLLVMPAIGLADNYTVHPGDDVVADVYAAPPGAPITFAPGNYTFTTNPTGPAIILPTGRQYIGNGAVLGLSNGVATDDHQELLALAGSPATTEFTGFVCTCAQIHCENGAFYVHNNNFTNGLRGIFIADARASQFNSNSFSSLTAEGIYGYPGNDNTWDSNTFDNVFEPIHLVSRCDSNDISGNTITHPTRIGIELQNAMTNLTVENNWISNWLPNRNAATDNHMAISCATMHGSNITISGNTLIQNGPTQSANVGIGWKSAIEIMGDSGVTIANNYCWNWSFMVLNGSGPNGYASSGNIEVGGALVGTDNVGGAYPIGQPQSTGDQLFALNDPTAPPIPPMPSTPPPPNAPPATPLAAPPTAIGLLSFVPASNPGAQTTTSIPAGLTATQGAPGQCQVTLPPGTPSATIWIYPSTLNPRTAVSLGTITGPVSITDIPQSWQVTIVAQINGVSYPLPEVQIMGGTWTPWPCPFTPSIVPTN